MSMTRTRTADPGRRLRREAWGFAAGRCASSSARSAVRRRGGRRGDRGDVRRRLGVLHGRGVRPARPERAPPAPDGHAARRPLGLVVRGRAARRDAVLQREHDGGPRRGREGPDRAVGGVEAGRLRLGRVPRVVGARGPRDARPGPPLGHRRAHVARHVAEHDRLRRLRGVRRRGVRRSVHGHVPERMVGRRRDAPRRRLLPRRRAALAPGGRRPGRTDAVPAG